MQNELEIKDITDSQMSACYIDLHRKIEKEEIETQDYHKNDDLTFAIINFPFISTKQHSFRSSEWNLYFITHSLF
jgi:hypothetical protein